MRLENTSTFRRGIISSHTPVKLGVLVWMYDFYRIKAINITYVQSKLCMYYVLVQNGNVILWSSRFERSLRVENSTIRYIPFLFCNKYPNFIRWFPFFSTYCNVKVLEQKKIVDQSTKFNCSSFAKKSLKNQMRNYYYHRTSVFRRDDLSLSSDCEVPCFW